MSKCWEYNKEYNSYSLYCGAFPGTWELGERRPIAVLNVNKGRVKERYTYSCYVVLRPGSLMPLEAKSIDEAKSKIEKAIIEYLEFNFDKHFTEMQIIDEELKELKVNEEYSLASKNYHNYFDLVVSRRRKDE